MITCIMPTADREQWATRAIELFLRQENVEAELIILDNSRGPSQLGEILKKHFDSPASVRYIVYGRVHEGPRPIGRLRNLCCELARGEWIAHWDDDDFYASWRLRKQLDHAAANPGGEVYGFHSMLYYDAGAEQLWRFDSGPGYVVGNSLFYRREFWQSSPFREDKLTEEDYDFQLGREVRSQPAGYAMIARMHAGNSSPKPTAGHWEWKPVLESHQIAMARALLR